MFAVISTVSKSDSIRLFHPKYDQQQTQVSTERKCPVGDLHQEITIVTDDPNEPLFQDSYLRTHQPTYQHHSKTRFDRQHQKRTNCPDQNCSYAAKNQSVSPVSIAMTIVSVSKFPTGGKTVHIIPMTLRAQLSGQRVRGSHPKESPHPDLARPRIRRGNDFIGKLFSS